MKKIIGLTGPSGAGKSTVSNAFYTLGAHVIDADRVARFVVEKGKPALFEIETTFGEQVILPGGELNRPALAEIVFRSPEALHKLNLITHKYIIEENQKEIEDAQEPCVVIDAAVLFESGLNELCHSVVCVTAERSLRLKRIMARDGLTIRQAQDRINAQNGDDFYVSRSDFHIENNGSSDALLAQAEQIFKGVCCE